MFKEKICISRIDKMGDMILTLPVIKSVKIHNPSSEIHVLASTYNAKVLKNIKYVDKVLLIGPNTNSFIKEIDIEPFNIGRYEPGGHFGVTHSERTSQSTLHRFFAFMTYLNDVEEGGETLFNHFNIKIKPKRGKTLIWPAEWTHAHSGKIVKSGKKYIITGHMHYPIIN